MKITIDTKDLKQFYNASSFAREEWYGQENSMKLEVIIEFLRFIGKEKAANELETFLNE